MGWQEWLAVSVTAALAPIWYLGVRRCGKWVFRQLVTVPVTAWARQQVREVVDEIHEPIIVTLQEVQTSQADLNKFVRNGLSDKVADIQDRVHRLEVR